MYLAAAILQHLSNCKT